jgi:acyl-CoA synthetase (AMP-forming)/AMP-acid ligase II
MDSEPLAVMMRARAARGGDRPALRYQDPATGAWQEISWTGLGEQVQAAP